MKAIFFSTGGIHLATMMGMLTELSERLEGVDAIGGISAGSLLAALCASYGVEKAITMMKSHYHDNFMKDRHKYLNTLLSIVFNTSIIDSSNLKRIVSNLLKGDVPLVTDLYIGYTNRDTMQYKCNKFEKGKLYPDLYQHVVASMSIPCVLEPTQIKDNKYIDAGMFHSIPVESINTVVQQSIEQKEPLDLMVLSARPWGYHLTSRVKDKKFFPMQGILYHLVSGFECISIHNDQLLLDKILENAKLKGDHINYSMFSINQKQTEDWTHKMPFEEYGHIKPEDVDALINLGKNIVLKCIKSDLKF